jgi:adenylate cyclase
MQKHGRVVIPLNQWKEARPFSGAEQKQVQVLLQRLPHVKAPPLPFAPPHVLQPPIPVLLNAAPAVGYADVNADPDGVYRNPLLLQSTTDGAALAHFSVAVACVAQGVALADAMRMGQLQFGNRFISLQNGMLWLQPIARRGGTFAAGVGQPVPTMSFADALLAPPEAFKDKIILVGETATGTTDVRPNPLDNGLRGVELNAEILANLLHLSPVRPMPTAVQWQLIVAAIGIPLWLYQYLIPRKATAFAGVALVGTFAVMETAFWVGRAVPSWSPVLMGFVGSTLLMGLQRLSEEEAKRRQLRQSFSTYVPPELVEAIVHQPELAHAEGVHQRVAVLFSDVRNFTPYSESNPAELVVRQMREYLTEMNESVFHHQGMLDKFIGDAVMALFNPFIKADINFSAAAVACALDMLERLERLNERWSLAGMPSFRIGIGIHVGEAHVGNVGSPLRMQYTALGDTVNLASRLQSATKELQTTLVVSDAVKQEAEAPLKNVATFVYRGTIVVKGREQPVEVYEVRRQTSS